MTQAQKDRLGTVQQPWTDDEFAAALESSSPAVISILATITLFDGIDLLPNGPEPLAQGVQEWMVHELYDTGYTAFKAADGRVCLKPKFAADPNDDKNAQASGNDCF